MKYILTFVLAFVIIIAHSKSNDYKNTKTLLQSMAEIESNYNPKAISNKGSLGILQIRYSVWKDELRKAKIINRREDLFNINKSVRACKYILNKYEVDKDLHKALIRYSGGDKNYPYKIYEAMKGDSTYE